MLSLVGSAKACHPCHPGWTDSFTAAQNPPMFPPGATWGVLICYSLANLIEVGRVMGMSTLPLHGEHITLAQALKAAGLAGTGGQSKFLIRNGDVTVNGEVVTQPGRKLVAGDRFRVADSPEWIISVQKE